MIHLTGHFDGHREETTIVAEAHDVAELDDGPPHPRRHMRALVIVAALLCAIGAIGLEAGHGRTPGSLAQPVVAGTSVFAHVPPPGHPFGVAVDGDRVYITTSDGDFFAPHLNSAGEAIDAYDFDGNLVQSTRVTTLRNATMGLNGVALDGNPEPDHHAYVADMNGRIIRLKVNQLDAKPRTFALPPPPFTYGNWGASMWNDLVFDRAGNLFMTDDKPRIWRVTPDGHAAIWFQDPRLVGLFGFAGGPLGGRIDPAGRYLYFAVTASLAEQAASVVYRLPLVDHPAASDLQVVHIFPIAPGEVPGQTSPDATGIAFAQSGDLYVSLTGRNQIAVLDPQGSLLRTISSPLFDSPWGLAFFGDSLLVTNAEIRPAEDRASWLVLKVFVGEPGLPLNRPRTDPDH
jgi:sugar lactone lactonase YvrE